MNDGRRWRRDLMAGAVACAIAGVGLALLVRYLWALPDDGTDGAGMAAMSFAFMFLIAFGAFLAFAVLTVVHRFTGRSLLEPKDPH